jgi:membrane-associated PAP2 superfamily phosphatase
MVTAAWQPHYAQPLNSLHPAMSMTSIVHPPRFMREGLQWLCCGALLLGIFEWLPLDFMLADWMYRGGHWVGAGNWWLESFSHHWVKQAVMIMVVLVWLRIAGSWRWPLVQRRRWLAMGLVMVLVPASIAGIKQISDQQCPWSLSRYGGPLPYFGLMTRPPEDGVAGRCFPAGHASTGFALLGWSLRWQYIDRRRAGYAASVAMVVGMLLGLGQQLRGAHFMSHTLWSAWIAWGWCWLVGCMLFKPVAQSDHVNRPAGQQYLV